MQPPDKNEFIALQTLLREDVSGAERQRLATMLISFRQSIKQRIGRGVPPDDYDRLQSVIDATTASEDVILAVWRGYHPT